MPKQPASPKSGDKSKESNPSARTAERVLMKKTGGPSKSLRVEVSTNPPEPQTTDPQPIGNDGDLRARIAQRAYELYERRGGHHGQDFDDWVRAEQEVLGTGC